MITWNVYDEHGILRSVYYEIHQDSDQCNIVMPSYVDERLEMERSGGSPGLNPSQRISITYPYEDIRVYRRPQRGSYVTYLRSRCPQAHRPTLRRPIEHESLDGVEELSGLF